MPAGADLHDYPELDNVQYFLIKLISLFFRHHTPTLNAYFLLGFPVITVSCMLVLRQFRISHPHCLLGGLIYTFLPYHFLRGENHILLASYWLVPPVAMLALWISRGTRLFWKSPGDTDRTRRQLRCRSLVAALICLLVSGTGYYAFFGCFFLLVAGLATAARARSVRPLLIGGTLTGLIALGLVMNLTPLLEYQHHHGENPAASRRNYAEAELYGLKIVQLVLPVTGHRIPALRSVKEEYNRSAPLVTENDSATLGIVATLGFLFLIGWLFLGDRHRRLVLLDRRQRGLVSDLSLLNLAAILLATIGGFAMLTRFLTPSLRGYNRISIYIAFFSVLVLVTMLDALHKRFGRSERARRLLALGTPVVVVVAILDQTTENFVPPYALLAEDLATRASFMQTVESKLPENAMLFQLPYARFPEGAPAGKMRQYDHLAGGYLVSNTLRWSYGAMYGRDTDRWQQMVAEQPAPELVKSLTSAGFSGIYVDRLGYPDGGAALEAGLARVLRTQPIVSRDRRRAIYSLEMSARSTIAGAM
jgi:phosphoglycerol transferase